MTIQVELTGIDRIPQKIYRAIAAEVNKRIKSNSGRTSTRFKSLVRDWVYNSPEMQSLLDQGGFGSLNALFGLPPGEPGMAANTISQAVADSMNVKIKAINEKFQGYVEFNFQEKSLANLLSLPEGHQLTETGSDLHWLDWLLTKGDAIVVMGFQYEASNLGRSGGGTMDLGGGFRVPPQFSGTTEDNFITRIFQGKDKQISTVLSNLLV